MNGVLSHEVEACESSPLGPLLSAVPPRAWRRYLWRYLDVPELLMLTETCWTLFVQCNDEVLWREMCLSPPYIDAEKKQSHFTFNGSWKHTACAFYFGRRRWRLSGSGEGKNKGSYGVVHCERSCLLLQTCRSLSEASVQFNVLLPRILTSLFRDGAMNVVEYDAWIQRTQPQRVGEDGSVTEGTIAAPPAWPTDATSLLSSDLDLSRWWQESVVGKPYVPALAQRYLQLSTGAINYFLHDGSFLRPPSSILKRDPQRKAIRRHTEFTDHNWAGMCLLDLVPLPPWCPVKKFLATLELKTRSAAPIASKARDSKQELNSIPRNLAIERLLPDELRGVPGVVDRRYRLSVHAFREEYETPNTPVVLTGCIDDWPARQEWQGLGFFQKFSAETLKANGRTTSGRRFRMVAADYVAYATAVNGEKPMYIFDKKILTRCRDLCRDYAVPPHFQEDFFAYMDEEERPDYRWVLVGPDGSGTPFHTDPHGTSAWNAVLGGCKRVTFYPPHVIPPGVEEKWIHSDYYASEPYLRWYRERCGHGLPNGTFSKEARRTCGGVNDDDKALRPVEALVFPGDVVFIPSGWWHQVLNIGFTTAVTQNFCSRVTFPRVVADMNAYAERQVQKDFQVALRRAGRDELAVQLRVPAVS